MAVIEWALQNGYSNELSIDRINGNGNYEPDNCRWANAKIQRDNQRPHKNRTVWTVDVVTKSAKEWVKEYNISYGSVKYRVEKSGMTVYQALTAPKSNGRPRRS